MKYIQKKFYYYQIIFGILTLIAGVLLHFVYEWSGRNAYVGLFAPINESTWEHLKLLFYPVVFFSILEYILVGHNFSAYITARILSLFSGLLFIIIFFYTYTGIIGTQYIWMDILTYFISVALVYIMTWYMAVTRKAGDLRTNLLCIGLLLILVWLFVRFTEKPPYINLFQSKAAKLVSFRIQ